MATLLLALVPLAQALSLSSEEVSTPYPGITVRQQRWASPQNDVWVAEVDLCATGIDVVATSAPSSYQTTGSWANAAQVELAVNGDFFHTVDGRPAVYGEAVGPSGQWPAAQTGVNDSGEWYYRDYGWVAFGAGWVDFTHTKSTKSNHPTPLYHGLSPTAYTSEIPEGTRALVSGLPELIVEGVRYTCSSATASTCFPDRRDMRERHPRTAMGLSADRRTFYLVVVDGRSTRSDGMYGTELAKVMETAGAWNAVNLDGGGSSTFWLRGEGVLNEPSDGSSRSVANHWGVHAGGSDPPRSCWQPGGCVPLSVVGAETAPFRDLPPTHLAAPAANAVVGRGLLSTCADDPAPFLCPDCGITRADAVGLAVGANGPAPAGPAVSPFSDVAPTHPHYNAIVAAVAAGQARPCGSGQFCPDGAMTRLEGADLMARVRGLPLGAPGPSSWSDVAGGTGPAAALEALTAACAAPECSPGAFCPDAPLTRGEAARMVALAWRMDGLNDCPPPGGDTGRDTAAPDSGPAPDTSPPGADTSGPAADSAAPLPRAGRRATPTPSGCICGTPSNATPANGAGVAAALALLAALGARRRRR